LVRKGYKVEIGRGISFTDDKNVRVKGSQIGFSLSEIKNLLIKNLSKSIELGIKRGLSLEI